ncbi:hypothetical protein GCM10027093_10960 [Paraburkholderia jirisanensis]
MKIKGTVALACSFAVAALVAVTPARAAADPHVFTQTCPNGDKIAVDMNHKTVAFTRGAQTYHATYDDGYALTWATSNPPLPAGVTTMPTGGQIGTDGAFFGDGDVDSNVVCPRDK